MGSLLLDPMDASVHLPSQFHKAKHYQIDEESQQIALRPNQIRTYPTITTNRKKIQISISVRSMCPLYQMHIAPLQASGGGTGFSSSFHLSCLVK